MLSQQRSRFASVLMCASILLNAVISPIILSVDGINTVAGETDDGRSTSSENFVHPATVEQVETTATPVYLENAKQTSDISQQLPAENEESHFAFQLFLPLLVTNPSDFSVPQGLPAQDDGLIEVVIDANSAATCALYPIAISVVSLIGVQPGQKLHDVFNGVQPGNFGWLTWTGEQSESELVKSLASPGTSDQYINPNDPQDHRLSAGDWVQGRPGLANSNAVRHALNGLFQRQITIPVWEQVKGAGANAQYQIVRFAIVELLSYSLPGENRISVRFLGYNASCSEGRAPAAVDDQFTTAEDASLVVQTPGVLANDTDPDRDDLQSLTVDTPVHGTLTLNADGSFAYTPSPDFSGLVRFTYQATDGIYRSNTATVTMTITPVNDPPVAMDDAAALDEDTQAIVTVLANDSDVDGDTLAVSAVGAPGHGAATVNPDATITYVPNTNHCGADQFGYTAVDGKGGAASAWVAIDVRCVNDAPVARDNTATTDEETTVNVSVLENDSDVDGDALIVGEVAQPAHGSTSIEAGAFVVYTPAADNNGLDSFTYSACDAGNLCAAATVTVIVGGIADPPMAVADAVTTQEDATVTINVAANDTDPDGDLLPASAVAVISPTHGSLVNNGDGAFGYLPARDYYGADGFTYSICDGTDLCATATVAIEVTPVNDSPVAAGDTYAVNEDTALDVPAPGVIVNDVDVDGDPLAVSGAAQPAYGTLAQNPDGSFVYMPQLNYCGPDAYTYTVADGSGGTDEGEVAITVTCVNDAPVAQSDAFAGIEDTTLAVAAPGVLANDFDVDGNALTLSVETLPLRGAVTLNPDGGFVYLPLADFCGADSFEYTIADASGLVSAATVTLDIACTNDPPVALDDAYDVAHETPLSVPAPGVLANDGDPNGDVLHAVGVVAPLHGLLELNTDGAFVYTPNAGYYGIDSFTYKANDSTLDSNVATVSIKTKAPLNNPPVANNDEVEVTEDVPVTISVVTNDSDPDGNLDLASANATSAPIHGDLTNNGDGSFRYAPDLNYNGADSFIYQVCDTAVACDSAAVSITVIPVNDAPVAVDENHNIDSGQTLTVPAPGVLSNDSDPDGDSLTAILVNGPAHGALTQFSDKAVFLAATGATSATGPLPFLGYVASAKIGSLTISNTSGSSASPVALGFGHVPAASVPYTDWTSLLPGVDLTVGEWEDLNITLDTPASAFGFDFAEHMTIRSEEGSFCGTASGCVDSVFTVSLLSGGSPVASFSFNAPNDVASFVGVVSPDLFDRVEIRESRAQGGMENDYFGQFYTGMTHGILALNANGSFTYTPAAGFTGSDTFTYKASDGRLDSSVATVTISVAGPVNQAPNAVDDKVTTEQGISVTFDVTDNDTDPEGNLNPASVVALTNVENGLLIDQGNGVFLYTPAQDFLGEDSFNYQVCDTEALCTVGQVTLTVTRNNVPPVVQDDAYTLIVVSRECEVGEWVAVPDLAAARYDHRTVLLNNGKILVTGGEGGGGPSGILAGTEIYDPATNTWAAGPSMGSPRAGFSATVLPDGRVLVAGGYGSSYPVSMASTEIYNPATNTWSPAADMGVPRSAHTATLLSNGKVLVGGGSRRAGTDPAEATAEIYDPQTNQWTPVPNMPSGRQSHTATLLDDGRVLIAGGNPIPWEWTSTSTAALFDPEANTWMAVPDMGISRASHTATLLSDGQVLVVGGEGAGPAARASAEIYNTTTNTWTPVSNMAVARSRHTATLLPTGKVLVGGGTSTGGTIYASAELYDPATNTWTHTSDLAQARNLHTATLLCNGKILSVGGAVWTGRWVSLGSSELYDPTGDDAFSIDQGQPLIVPAPGVLGNDSDPNGDPLTAVLVTASQHGALSLIADGSFTYTPSVGFLGTDSFTYTANDGQTNSNVAKVSLTVVRPPSPPIAMDDAYVVNMGQPLTVVASGVLGNDSDANGDALKAVLVSQPQHGTLTLNPDGSFIYVSEPDYVGSDTFTYKANDGSLDSNIATVTITVSTPLCTAAYWQNVPDLSIARYQHVSVQLADGRVLVTGGTQARSTSGDDLGSTEIYEPASNSWQMGPPLSTPRAALVAVRLLDGRVLVAGGEHLGVGLATVEIYDPITNRWSPGASMIHRAAGTATLLKNGLVLVTGGAEDPPYTALASAEVYDPATDRWLSAASMSTGRATHTATLLNDGRVLVVGGLAAGWGPASLDSAEVYDPATNTWSPAGRMRYARNSHTASLLQDGRVLIAGGEEGDPLTPLAKSEIYDPATNTWSLGPEMGSPRSRHSATSLDDGRVLVAGGFAAGNSRSLVSVELFDPVAFRWIQGANMQAGRILHTATQLCNGRILLVGGMDGTEGSAIAMAKTEMYDPKAISVPRAPLAADDAYSLMPGETLSISAPGVLGNDSDPNGDPLTALLVTGPANGTLTLAANGSFTYTPAAGFTGSDTFTYKANDGRLDSSVATVTITVATPSNRQPRANDDVGALDEDTVLAIPAPGVLGNDIDPDSNPLTASLVSNPAHGTLTLNINGSYVYTPAIDFNGSDNFTYKANDGSLDSNVATVNLAIAPVNDAPIAIDYATTMPEDRYMVCPAPCLLGRLWDYDGDPLTVRVGNLPVHGTLDLRATGALTYTPHANFTGVDTFTFIGNDGQIDSNPGTITITVLPAADQPIAANDSYRINKDATLIVAAPGVLANDSDPDGGVLTAVLLTGPAHGTLSLNATGAFTYTPTAGYTGADSFIYRARNASLYSEETTVAIDVGAPPNQPPIAVDDAYTAVSDQPLVVAAPGVLANDTDPDGSPLTGRVATSVAHGALTLRADGSFIYTPTLGFTGSDSFAYVASDGSLDSNQATVAITVAGALVVVPDVRNLPQAAAENALSAAGLAIGNLAFSASTTVPAGSVVSQDPAPGTSVQKATPVSLIISAGNATGGLLSIVVTPGTAAIAAGRTQQFVAMGSFDDGTSRELTAVVAWSSSSLPIANVTPKGVAVALDPGTVTVRATMNGVSSAASLTVTPAELVSITVEPAAALILAGQQQPFKAVGTYSDGTGRDLTGVTWSVTNGAVARMSTGGIATALAAGSTGVRAQSGALAGDATLTVRTPVADGTLPTVEITAPQLDAEVTTIIDVIGTATDANFLNYKVEIAPVGATTFTEIGSGSAPVAGGLLARLDPTLLPNDLYTVRLTAFDRAGNGAQTEVIVQINGNQKVGNFTVAFEDVNVGTPCLPLSVNRVYDSRVKAVGDFGVGWRLDTRTIQLRESTTQGAGWYVDLVDESGPFGITIPTYYLVGDTVHKVSITLPDGHVEEFDLTPSPTKSQYSPILAVSAAYAPRPGTLGSLAPVGETSLAILDGQPGPVDLLYESDLAIFDPQAYRYTAPDGTVYIIDKRQGLQSAECTTGARLTFSPNGVTHTNGQSIGFVRDGQGRITQISDLNGNVRRYAYDARGDLASYTDASGAVTEFVYNYRHDLLEIRDPRGVRGIRNEYDDAGRILGHTDANGNQIDYVHDLAARTESVVDRRGFTTTYAYDARGNVLRTTDALGHVTSYTYDAFDNEVTVTDPLGNTATRTFDLRHNVLDETDPLGNVTRFTYTALDNIRSLTDPLGRVTRYEYDSRGFPTTTTDALGQVTRNTYDTGGIIIPGTWNLVASTDALGNVTGYEYDDQGRVTKEINPLGYATVYTYDANGNRLTETVTRTTDAGVQTLVTAYAYDDLDRLVQTTYPDGSTTQTEYNAAGQQSATIDQMGRRTTFAYDLAGHLVKTVYPDGTSTSSTYDAEGNQVASTDRMGRTTRYEYDALNRLVRTIHPDGAAMATEYDAAGRVAASVDENGNRTTFEYDAAGRRSKTIDALGHVTTISYDATGNQLTMTDAKNHVYTYEYDSLNRRVRTLFPDGTDTETSYDASGRRVATTDQANLTTRYGYDALGRLTSVTDALGQVTAYSYDEGGSQLTQTDANGNTTTFGYDSLSRRIRRTLPLGQTETYTYDAAGQMTGKTGFNGDTTTYEYDSLGRLTARLPDPDRNEPAVRYSYLASGQRARMEDASGITVYSYDLRDRLLSKATGWGTLSYTYDAVGNLTSTRSSNANGVWVEYTFDALNRLQQANDRRLANGVTSYTYDEVGNLASFTYPNNVQHAYTYDSLNRLTLLTVGKGFDMLASYNYTLGLVGNRLGVSEFGGRTVSYTYDALYRLKSETIAADPNGIDGVIAYTYDPVGNRLERTSTVAPVPATTYGYDADDRLLSDTYDDNGNTLTSEDKTYAYNFENRLVNFNNGEVTMLYDGDGNRVAKTVGGVTTYYLVDDQNLTGYAQVLEEIVSGTVQVQYTYGLDLASQNQLLGVSFYGYDGHGSVRLVMSSNASVSDRYDYDAFGVSLTWSEAVVNDYRYSGERLDPALGLYFLRARYYDQGLGRFLALDLLDGNRLEQSSLHKYTYTANNPVDRVDPSGLLFFADLSVASSVRMTLSKVQAGIGYELLKRTAKKLNSAEANYLIKAAELAEAAIAIYGIGRLAASFARRIIVPGGNILAVGKHYRTALSGLDIAQRAAINTNSLSGNKIMLGRFKDINGLNRLAKIFDAEVISQPLGPHAGIGLDNYLRMRLESADHLFMRMKDVLSDPDSVTYRVEYLFIRSRPDLLDKTIFIWED